MPVDHLAPLTILAPVDPEPLSPPAIPPPIPAAVELAQDSPPAPGPWGFWLTLAFGGFIVMADVAVQTVIVLVAAGTQGALNDPHAVEALAYNGFVLSMATLISLPVTVGLAVLFAFIRPGIRVVDYLGLKPATWKPTVLALLSALAVGLAWDLAGRWAGRPELPEFMSKAYQSAGFVPLLWIAVIIGAPVGEEMFFRGFLLSGIAKSRVGGLGAVVITSLAWAAIHVQYDLFDISYIFCLGLVIGWFRLRTGSLWPPILMHMLVNLIATIQVALLVG